VPEPDRPLPTLSPSGLGGAKALAGESGLDEETAKAEGRALHLLLEHLPAAPRRDWPGIARALIADDSLRVRLLADAMAILDAPGLAAVFAPGTLAEVALSADLNGRRMLGTIDRLIIGPTTITAIDIKSNRVVPATPDAVPEGILRQMGAYRAALAQIYPHHRIAVAILWTATARLMPLDPDIVSAALARTTIP
jgi:ATP-dependent helicase/nuclease subunit A